MKSLGPNSFFFLIMCFMLIVWGGVAVFERELVIHRYGAIINLGESHSVIGLMLILFGGVCVYKTIKKPLNNGGQTPIKKLS